MTQLNQDSSLWLLQTLRDLQVQVAALATQQQYQVAGTNGPAMTIGTFPGSPPTYGMEVYDALGDLVVAVGDFGATYGINIYDSNGNLRAELGLLSTGDYGLQVIDPNGVHNEVWPVSSGYYDGSLQTASPSYVPLTDSPSVSNCYIGASGDALITVSATVETAASASSGMEIALFVDGSQYPASNDPILSVAGSSITVPASSTRRFSLWSGTLTPNTSHTFSLKYLSNSGTVFASGVGIYVQPL
jgi:hypothetical protein